MISHEEVESAVDVWSSFQRDPERWAATLLALDGYELATPERDACDALGAFANRGDCAIRAEFRLASSGGKGTISAARLWRTSRSTAENDRACETWSDCLAKATIGEPVAVPFDLDGDVVLVRDYDVRTVTERRFAACREQVEYAEGAVRRYEAEDDGGVQRTRAFDAEMVRKRARAFARVCEALRAAESAIPR